MALEDKSMIELEAETQRMVSDSISKMEVAISEWDSAKKKPDDLSDVVEGIRRFHELLSAWERKSLAGSRDTASIRKRLARFTEICAEIESSGLF